MGGAQSLMFRRFAQLLWFFGALWGPGLVGAGELAD
jgi:hypothetical protein